MVTLEERVARYRKRAEEARTTASQLRDQQARRSLEAVAEAFDEMVVHFEELIRMAKARKNKEGQVVGEPPSGSQERR